MKDEKCVCARTSSGHTLEDLLQNIRGVREIPEATRKLTVTFQSEPDNEVKLTHTLIGEVQAVFKELLKPEPAIFVFRELIASIAHEAGGRSMHRTRSAPSSWRRVGRGLHPAVQAVTRLSGSSEKISESTRRSTTGSQR